MLLDWFRSRKRQEEDEPPLKARMRALEADMRQLELDWETTYGKVRRALATLSRRQAREDGKEEESATVSANGGADLKNAKTYGELLQLGRRRYGGG